MKKVAVKIVLLIIISLNLTIPVFSNNFDYSQSVSLGNYLKMLCDCLGYKAEQAEQGAHWAEPYADIAYSYCWILKYPTNFDVYITRQEASELLLEAMGIVPNHFLEVPFSDTNDDDFIASTIYDIGFYKGETKNGRLIFSPNSTINYTQALEMFQNVARYFREDYMKTDFRYFVKQVPRPSYYGELSIEYFHSVFEYMILTDVVSFDVCLRGISFNSFNSRHEELIDKGYNKAKFVTLAELGMFFDTYTYSRTEKNGNVIITFEISNSNFSPAYAVSYKHAFMMSLEEILEDLINSRQLNIYDSDYNKARFLYQWCALNYEYDKNFNAISYTGYGIVWNRIGVCQAYVALYNSLCKMLGIEIVGAPGQAYSGGRWGEHIWSYAKLNGSWVYIDPTWGDRGNSCNFEYFAITRQQILKTHKFDVLD